MMRKPKSKAIFEEVAEETGLACALCQEGYGLAPNKPLGFYIFAKPMAVSLEATEGGLGVVSIMNMVTHFTVVHKPCHDDAARADRHMRKPKTEWEGARIRNQHTLCNNWFPIIGPEIVDTVFSKHVDIMFSSYEFLDCSRETNAIHDLRLMISRFANETSFTKDSKGGGPEYNLSAIPHMVNLVWFLLTVDSDSAAEALTKFESLDLETGSAEML
jgi:E3 ubiquitin-protein ligase UBR4